MQNEFKRAQFATDTWQVTEVHVLGASATGGTTGRRPSVSLGKPGRQLFPPPLQRDTHTKTKVTALVAQSQYMIWGALGGGEERIDTQQYSPMMGFMPLNIGCAGSMGTPGWYGYPCGAGG